MGRHDPLRNESRGESHAKRLPARRIAAPDFVGLHPACLRSSHAAPGGAAANLKEQRHLLTKEISQMSERLDYRTSFPEGLKAMYAMEAAIRRSGLEPTLL